MLFKLLAIKIINFKTMTEQRNPKLNHQKSNTHVETISKNVGKTSRHILGLLT